MRQIFLDTETTGLEARNGDRILEIGCVELVQRKLTGNNLHLYINPERDSHEEALAVHGITSEFLADKPKFREIADRFLDFVAGAEVIIHNAEFDVGFLDEELKRLGRGRFAQHVTAVTDSSAMAKAQFPGKRNSLDALCSRLEVDNSGRTLHGALLDAELLAEVYIRMTRGQDALLMEPADSPGDSGVAANFQGLDLSTFDLPVLRASDTERSAHDAVLAEIDKSSGGKTYWRALEPVATA